VLEPIPTGGYGPDDVEALGTEARARIEQALPALRARVAAARLAPRALLPAPLRAT
jgi:hypothetical protein